MMLSQECPVEKHCKALIVLLSLDIGFEYWVLSTEKIKKLNSQ